MESKHLRTLALGLAVGALPLGLATTPAVGVPGTFQEFAATGTSLNITNGPAGDGNLWFTEQVAHKVAKITTAGVLTEYTTPADVFPSNIHAGPDGKIYYTEFRDANDHRFARINTDGTGYQQFAAPTSGSGVRNMATGSDGNIWIAEQVGTKILRFNPTTLAMKEFRVGNQKQPWGITAGPDGALWYTVTSSGQIGRMTTSGSNTLYTIPNGGGSQPMGITVGPDNNLWFVENLGNKVGRITPAGVITEFALPPFGTTGNRPKMIAAGPDGNLWFTENASNKIGRITTAGVLINEYTLPTENSAPFGITKGPDDKMWFAENGGAFVGNVTAL